MRSLTGGLLLIVAFAAGCAGKGEPLVTADLAPDPPAEPQRRSTLATFVIRPVCHELPLPEYPASLLPLDLPPEQFAALLTRNGGEDVDLGLLESTWKLHWAHIVALITLGVSYAILLLRPRRAIGDVPPHSRRVKSAERIRKAIAAKEFLKSDESESNDA